MVMSLRTPRVLNYLTVMPHQSEACNKRLQIPGKAVQAEISKGLPHTKGSAIPGCGLKGTLVFLGERALRFLFFCTARVTGRTVLHCQEKREERFTEHMQHSLDFPCKYLSKGQRNYS